MDFESLKGFRDFYPGEMQARRRVLNQVRETAHHYGFQEIGAPSLEPMELYEVKSGEEIVEETFSFEDRGGRHVTLTPELTPSLVRMYVAREQELAKPVKWFSVPKLWRYEQPQSGRLREFVQPNFDVLGVEGVEADAELISFADTMLRNLGLDDEYVFRVSHRGVVQGVVEELGLEGEQAQRVYREVDKSERFGREEFRERLREAGLDDDEVENLVSLTRLRGFDELSSVKDYASNRRTREAVQELEGLRDALEGYGVLDTCTFDPSIVRGLDYYTGVVFECFDVEGDLRAIFGGGRYDDLVEEFGGTPTPAVGFGVGDATLELLLRRAGEWPSEDVELDYYVAVIGDVRETAVRVADNLRREGHRVDIEMRGRSFTGQLEHADALGADKTVVVGERDLSDDVLTVKDMESGDQRQVDVEEYL